MGVEPQTLSMLGKQAYYQLNCNPSPSSWATALCTRPSAHHKETTAMLRTMSA
ncbi:hypothetical protein LEMLEM_LOCUS1148 [Lemmus lemmus]